MIKVIFIGIASIIVFGIGFSAISSQPISRLKLKSKYPDRHFDEIQLPLGRTHYQSVGNGPTVILIHGVSGPLAVWDKVVELLVSAGFRVVRFDLFGRGFSERLSDSEYNLDLYVQQVEQLIVALNLGSRVRIVGSSFGAVVASEFTLRHPEIVDRLVLIGPAGFPITVPWTARLGKLPLVGPLLTSVLAYRVILKQNDHYFVNGKLPDELRLFVAAQLSVEGTTHAILQTMQNSPVQSFVESYQRLGSLEVPVGVIWGRQDRTFPYENAAVLSRAIPKSQLVTIENAGHLPQYERAEEVIPALIDYLNSMSRTEK